MQSIIPPCFAFYIAVDITRKF